MIIYSKKYNGDCSCGKYHKMTTECCIIEAGCLECADKYISQNGLSGKSVAIYDENTYAATKGMHPKADIEVVLPPDNLHADNHGVAMALNRIPEECGYLIAIGAGTIHDITRYCAYERHLPFVSCPTAASVDGFCSSVAAMTWDGFKKTFEAVAPRIVIADLNVISKAPKRLTNSGFGDMIGKFIALADWKIAHLLIGENFCSTIHDMTMDATKAVLESTAAINKGEITAFEKLTYGLLMSGLAMQLLGSSRCASGAEHHISHLIEMQPAGLCVKSNALHGEKVGVGTLIVSQKYHEIATDKNIIWTNYSEAKPDYIKDMFGESLGDSVVTENLSDCASGITAKTITENWDAIRDIINEIPSYDDLIEKYEILGVQSKLGDINVPEEKLETLLEYAPLVRNRLTLLRLCRAM